ncbi:UPF0175 family protein [Nodosilinea sp. PGN35]|uniref:UPF0175 family protein n=1 Tax=Nodosilinea sp. PGN35 TaxID=3020489 RepID=UPI0023B31F8A|nr:UPF0175 family protein [Nodosilinea sp. TSF1-S3]MDF0366956.1 UPF0175 family protein [Nodosilinea sp. TSF1-S3]
MQMQLELPDSVNVDQRYIQEALMAVLYSSGKVSAHQACQILNMTRRSFDEILPHYGFSALIDSNDNLDIELSA